MSGKINRPGITPAALGAVLIAMALIGSNSHAREQTDRPSPERRLAKAVAGRQAGTPVSCIRLSDIDSTQIIDRTAIIYRLRNGTLMVNRPDLGASTLDSDDVLVTDTHSSQLCDVDVVKVYDSGARMLVGAIGLGKFTPYPRPRQRRR